MSSPIYRRRNEDQLPRFSIRRALEADTGRLFEIWWDSVRATHAFLHAEDLDELATAVHALGLARLDTWVLQEDSAGAVGFIAMEGAHVVGLFLSSGWLRRGGGSLLLEHMRDIRGELTVDVNEQNEAALQFYRARGFSVVGRSARDGEGRPFPLLHLAERPGAPGDDPPGERQLSRSPDRQET
jgi:putative acetyltransferase